MNPKPNPTPAPGNTKRYSFHITTDNNGNRELVMWRGMTLVQARNMYAWTDKHQPQNVIAYGWSEEKE